MGLTWSKEYCNLQHLGPFSTKQTWVTVERFPYHAILRVWFPGCQFSPDEYRYDTVEKAKADGEKMMRLKGHQIGMEK